jgi:sulfur relay (sulfurtransferase) DsrC/TusE family protein
MRTKTHVKAGGVDEMTDEHWKLVDYLRDYYLKYGVAPMIR